MPRLLPLLFAVLISRPGLAVKIAFLENYHAGKLMQLEPGGRFAHVAIAVGEKYLHAHPALGGVELTTQIETFGVNVMVYENKDVPEPTPERVARYLRMPYHPRLQWAENDGTTYNARLVGELLGIAPQPALFRAEIWQNFESGAMVGLSPDDIHRVITREMGFRLHSCDGLLVH